MNLFDSGKKPLKIDKPIRLIELFSGIGSQAKALERLGADFEHYRTSEWEISAVASYKAIHKHEDDTDYSKPYSNEELLDILCNLGISTDGKKPMTRQQISRKNEQWKRTVYNNFKATNNIGSIVNVSGADLGIVNTDKYCYILCYSFPCQDLSLAGTQKLMAKGSGTRSALLWEVERLLDECNELPQILLMENVTQVHGKKNIEHFDEWLAFLESKGYRNYWKDLNAKNFGIPQNRNRTFMVSILGDYTYEFPQEFPLQLRLKDMLEDSVDEKYYLSDKGIEYILKRDGKYTQVCDDSTEIAKAAITAVGNANWTGNFVKEPKCEMVGMLLGGKWDKLHDISRGVYSGEGVAPTIHTSGGGQQEPKVIEPRVIGGVGEKESNGGTQWYQQDRIYDNELAISVTTGFLPCYKTEEPIVVGKTDNHQKGGIYDVEGIGRTIMSTDYKQPMQIAEPLAYDEQNGYIRKDGTVGTLTTDGSSPKHNNRVVEDMRIRKLTPKECWRLMGFDDVDFEKAAQFNSNSQLYKQAGNSIVVDVLYYIFREMV